MPRFKLTLEYDGAPFVGWQRQGNGLSVQEALEGAILAMTAEQVTAHGAGRTDAGVHALGQVAHVDLVRDWAPFRLREGLNALLRPHPVAVLGVERVSEDFDARHSASARHYRYRIANRRAPLTFERGQAWRVKPRLDAEAMHAAARVLIGATTSPPSAIRSARRNRRSAPSTGSTSGATATRSCSRRARARSCIARCARRWARSSGSGRGAGARRSSRRRSRPPIAAAAARWRPRTASISRGWIMAKRALWSAAAAYPPPRTRGRIRSAPPTARRTQRNRAPAPAHRCATAPRDRRAPPARRQHESSR